MLKYLAPGAVLSIILGASAFGQTCPANPYALSDGATAYGSQVIANFNNILNCINSGNVAPSANAHFTGYVGIGTAAPDRSLVIAGTHPTLGLYDPSGATMALSPPTATSGSVGQIDIAGSNDFRIDTNATERLRVDSSGNVNIATAGPAANLNMNGNIDISVNHSFYMNSTSGFGMQFSAQGDNNFVMYNSDSGGNNYAVFAQFMRTTNASFNFYSPVLFYGSYSTASDIRLKKNIQPLSGALTVVQQLRPVTYDWRTASERTVGKKLNLAVGEHQIGFIAQELQKVMPDAVRVPTEPDGVYSIKEQDLIPILVQAIKEQQAEIVLMQAKIMALEGRQ